MTAPSRLLRQLPAVIGVLVALALPALDVAPTVGLITALLALAVMTAAVAVATRLVSPAPHRSARHALRQLRPRPAQSDPDARGHARPRAPGRLLPAV